MYEVYLSTDMVIELEKWELIEHWSEGYLTNAISLVYWTSQFLHRFFFFWPNGKLWYDPQNMSDPFTHIFETFFPVHNDGSWEATATTKRHKQICFQSNQLATKRKPIPTFRFPANLHLMYYTPKTEFRLQTIRLHSHAFWLHCFAFKIIDWFTTENRMLARNRYIILYCQ